MITALEDEMTYIGKFFERIDHLFLHYWLVVHTRLSQSHLYLAAELQHLPAYSRQQYCTVHYELHISNNTEQDCTDLYTAVRVQCVV